MADLTPLTLISGLPGSGKTLYTLFTVEEYAKRSGRTVYYFGIPQLTLDWILLDDPKLWFKLPKNSIIVIDEAQFNLFPVRSPGSAVPDHVSQANILRHSGFSLVIITQHPMLIDSAIRKLVTCHYHVVRFYGFNKSTIHEFPQVRENCDKSLKASISNHFVYPKQVYNWYKSAETHTIKKRIPMRLVLIVVLPILLIGAIYWTFHALAHIDKQAHAGGVVSAPGSASPSVPGSASSPALLSSAQYAASFKPRLAGLPNTAPRYDEVTKPTAAPYPKACISSATKCSCISQQGTHLDVPDALCRNIAANGYFVDFDDKKSSSSDRSTDAQHYRAAGAAQPVGDASKPMALAITPNI